MEIIGNGVIDMQKAVEIISRGLTLRGMLHTPDNMVDKVPIVLIFHGFAGNKMANHFMFVKLSRRLEKEGVASLRFDFGGSGESDGDFIDMTIAGELTDANRILNFAKELEFVDRDRIGIVGLSMGGAVASMLAGERKADIRSLCLWAPAGNMGEIVLEDFIGDKYEDFRSKGYLDYSGLLMGKNFADGVISTDIYRKASGFDKNVLLIHGDNDQVVPLSASNFYKRIYRGRSELKIIQGGDHTFDKKEWEEEVIALTVDFLEKDLAPENVFCLD